MILYDTHAHYDDQAFDRDRDALLPSLPGKGVGYVNCIGSDMASSRRAAELAVQYGFVYAAVGVHPQAARGMKVGDLGELAGLLRLPEVKALGEIGLDYHYETTDRKTQQVRFAEQMDLAQSMNVPVVIHEREATADCLRIIRQFRVPGGVFHCYSGSLETAKELINLGYSLSFTGVITFKNARKSHEVVRWVPEDRIMIETDSPYLTPEPHRGKRNDSTYLHYTAQAVADLRGIPLEQAAEVTTRNGLRFFGIEES